MGHRTDTVYRQWMVLQQVPRYPLSRSTAEIHDALRKEGLDVKRRTVQRDLVDLSALFPLTNEPEGAGLRWFWMEKGPAREFPAMTPATALTLQLARDHLDPLFPPSLLAVLQPYFERADAVLGESHLSHWRSKVRIAEDGPSLGVPSVEADVRDGVYRALLEERQLEVGYYSRNREQHSRRRLHPLGLVARGGLFYLVAWETGSSDVRQFALHRMDAPALSEESVDAPADFDLDHYLQEKVAFFYPRSPALLPVHLWAAPPVAFHLRERPLAEDQVLEPTGDGGALVSATVPDTEALRWWLLGFGANVRVDGPESLRNEMQQFTAEAAALYQTTTEPSTS